MQQFFYLAVGTSLLIISLTLFFDKLGWIFPRMRRSRRKETRIDRLENYIENLEIEIVRHIRSQERLKQEIIKYCSVNTVQSCIPANVFYQWSIYDDRENDPNQGYEDISSAKITIED